MPTPAEVLAQIVRSDSTRPRLTFYDDAAGPTRGERIELSARVLVNWVSKAGNALQEELDVEPGTEVVLCMPVHWRAVYWALAAWSVGATVVLPDGSAGGSAIGAPDGTSEEPPGGAPTDVGVSTDDEAVLVTDDRALAAGFPGRSVLVSLPMLARSRPDLPAGAFDEARELATYGDVLDAWAEAEPGDAALRVGSDGEPTAYRDVVPQVGAWGAAPRVLVTGTLAEVLTGSLAAWALDGSVVLVRDAEGDQTARLAAEGVTHTGR